MLKWLFVLMLLLSVTFTFAESESACERQVLLAEGFLSDPPVINTDAGWVILLDGDDSHSQIIFKFSIETGEMTTLTPAEVNGFEPLFLDSEQETVVYFQGDQLKAVDLQGDGTARTLTDEPEGVNNRTSPAVGSEHVVYLSPDQLALKSVRLDGTAPPITLYQGETITKGMQTVYETVKTIIISPDGQWVFFSADQFDAESETVLYRVPIEGGDPVRVSTESITHFLLTDHAVIYRTRDTGRLISHALDTDQAMVLTPPDHWAVWFGWVNDRVFYTTGSTEVVNRRIVESEDLYMVSEGQVFELLPVEDVLYSPQIVVIDQQVYFAKTANTHPHNYGLYRHNLRDGTTETLIERNLWTFGMAGDAILAVTRVSDARGDLYLIDEDRITHLNATDPGQVDLPASYGLDTLFFNASLIAYNFVNESDTRIGVVYHLDTRASEVFEGAWWMGLEGTSVIYNDIEARSVVLLQCD